MVSSVPGPARDGARRRGGGAERDAGDVAPDSPATPGDAEPGDPATHTPGVVWCVGVCV